MSEVIYGVPTRAVLTPAAASAAYCLLISDPSVTSLQPPQRSCGHKNLKFPVYDRSG